MRCPNMTFNYLYAQNVDLYNFCNAQALYGNPPAPPSTVGASSYPKPESIRWDSPVYADGSADDVLTTAATTAADKVQ
jgi:hypothetical protein